MLGQFCKSVVVSGVWSHKFVFFFFLREKGEGFGSFEWRERKKDYDFG